MVAYAVDKSSLCLLRRHMEHLVEVRNTPDFQSHQFSSEKFAHFKVVKFSDDFPDLLSISEIFYPEG